MKKFLSRILALGILLTIVGAIVFAIGFSISGFNFSKMSSISTVDNSYKEGADAQVDNIEIIFNTSDIAVIFDENATEISIAYQTLESKNNKALTEVSVTAEAGKLTLEERAENKLYLFPIHQNPKATVTIPASREITLAASVDTGDITIAGNATLKSLKIESDTGDIYATDAVIKSLSDMSFETDTGKIKLGKFDTDTLSIEGGTGNVSIVDGIVAGKAEIELSTGDLTVISSLAAKTVEIKASSGDVLFKGNVKTESLLLDTSTGEIESDGAVIDAEEITIETSTADVELTLKGKLSDYTVLVEQSTGESNITNRTGGSRTLNINVSTGDIEIEFKE